MAITPVIEDPLQKKPIQQTAQRADFLTPDDEIDFGAISKTVKETAADVREVDIPSFPDVTISKGSEADQKMVQALKSSYESQAKATQKQAKKAGTALEVTGAATEQYLKSLEGITAGQIPGLKASSTARWNEAIEKADEYVQASRDRVQSALKVIDDLNTQIGEGREFAKAHAMQAGVQATIGQMNSEGRNIAETYGLDSKEYQSFEASKKVALGGVFSNITTSYQKIQEQQDLAFMSATNETLWKHNMYSSYQEQQHVDTLKYMAQAQNVYDLQLAQFTTSIEGLKMAGMENLANWIIATPAYAMDLTPYMASILNIEQAAEARAMAQREFAAGTAATRRAQTLAEKTQREQSALAQRAQTQAEKPPKLYTKDFDERIPGFGTVTRTSTLWA